MLETNIIFHNFRFENENFKIKKIFNIKYDFNLKNYNFFLIKLH